MKGHLYQEGYLDLRSIIFAFLRGVYGADCLFSDSIWISFYAGFSTDTH